MIRNVYNIFVLACVFVSGIGVILDERTFLTFVTVACFFVVVVGVAVEAYKIWGGRGDIGRFILMFGSLFWFWLEAIRLSLEATTFKNYAQFASFIGGSFSTDTVAISLFCLSIFFAASLFSWELFNVKKVKLWPLRERLDGRNGVLFDWVMLGFSCVGWLPKISSSGGIEQAIAMSALMRSSDGLHEFDSGLMNYLPILSLVSVSISVVRMVLRRPGSVYARITAVFVGLLLVLASGTRFKVVYVFMPVLFILLSKASTNMTSRARKMVLYCFVLLMVSAAAFQFSYRYGGASGYKAQISAVDIVDKSVRGADHFSALMLAVALVPDRHDYFMQPILPFFITHYIPRFIWPEKPAYEYWEYYNRAYLRGYADGNLTPSVLGQYYLNWGVFGALIIGVVFGCWAKLVDLWLDSLDVGKYSLSASVAGLLLTFLFLSFRQYSPMYFVYPLLAFFIYIWWGRPLRNKAPLM